MKKILIIAMAIVSLAIFSSCQKPGLSLTPSSLTLKVGERAQLHPTILGEVDFTISDVIRINPDDESAYLDSQYRVTAGDTPGTTKVGIGVLNDPKDTNKGLRYEAWTIIKIVE